MPTGPLGRRQINPGDRWVGVSGPSISGAYFAVIYWMNPDMAGFQEPYNTGVGRYAKVENAEREAYFLALAEDLPYDLPASFVPPSISEFEPKGEPE